MNNLLCLVNWVNREKITLFIGSLFLILGAILPWYQLPPQALEIFGTNLSLVNIGRILAALFALIGFIYVFCFTPGRVPRLPFWSGLIVVLLFPYLITTWSPTATFLAASYYDQGKRVSQHVENNFPQVQAQWKQNISLYQSIPITSISDFVIKDSRFFQASSWVHILIEGLGYSDNFLKFLGRGWLLTVIGFVVSLLAIYLGIIDDNFNIFLRDICKFIPWLGVLLGILVFSLIWSNIVNYQLDTMFAKGDYHQVVAESRTLASWYPPLSGDEEFLKRMAEAAFYGNESEPALIYFAKGLERYRLGDFLKAEDYFRRSLDIQPSRFLVKGYLATTLLNEGISYFNNLDNPSNHKPGVAADHFEEALHIFPGHLEALYDLMLARVVNGEFEKSASVAQQIIEVDQYSQQPNLSLLGQAYLHLAWASFHRDDTTRTWKQFRQSLDSSTWKKSSEVHK